MQFLLFVQVIYALGVIFQAFFYFFFVRYVDTSSSSLPVVRCTDSSLISFYYFIQSI